ncbi:MAG: [FeFe] hydrogenase H-cluster radical SAM maturase HydE, partial [Deltaproteobacteria bacterium]|nr:[FeFe] hydrogenase H-cluster radical SAM maturase HydE [Deltaproteobacteria bacterium]
MTRDDLLVWLKEENPQILKQLWHKADRVRADQVGNAVHLRGLIEISNHCKRLCTYCGLNADNRSLKRYRLTEHEILDCANMATEHGYGTIVMQAGEDKGIKVAWLTGIIKKIKKEIPLAVTLSLGERDIEELGAWRDAGADRYLLRFETSDRDLYAAIHPASKENSRHRIEQLHDIQQLGYETGSGILIGIPGQTYASIAQDLLLLRQMDIDMIGVGPWLPHPATPLGAADDLNKRTNNCQVPNTELMTLKVMALARILCPKTNIPATTALATINADNGHSHG